MSQSEILTGQQIDIFCTCTEFAHPRVQLSAYLYFNIYFFDNMLKAC